MEPTPDQKTTPATGTPSPRKEYGEAQIQVLEGLEAVRKRLDFNVLLHEAKKRGDSKKLIEKYSLKNNSLFARALSEAKLLNFFPDLEKSKAPLLTTFKIRRELDLFMKTSDIKAMPVRSLRKAIKEWKSTLSKNPRILLSEEQHNVIIGMLLGDGSLRKRGKNTLFRVEHSEKQKDYLFWIHDLFSEFTLSKPKSYMHKNHKYASHSFTTFAHPLFNYYYGLFYKDGRKQVNEEILNQITPQGLAMWISDDGSYCNSIKDMILCTNSFSLEEHKLMQKYFLEKWGLNCSIRFRDGKYYYLTFYKKDTGKLIDLIKDHIPVDNMRYKIGEKND